jgi:hypothetical protein
MIVARRPLRDISRLGNILLQDSSEAFVSVANNTCINLPFYFSHIYELFVLALEDNRSAISCAAYRVLTTTSAQMAEAIVREDIFNSFVSDLLSTGDLSEAVISRISSIGYRILSHQHDNTRASHAYMLSFLKYIHYYDVADVFMHILSPNPRYAGCQSELIDLGLPTMISVLASQLPSQITDDKIRATDRLISIFRLLTGAFTNEVVAQYFAISGVISALSEDFTCARRVADEQWIAIIAFSRLTQPPSTLFLEKAIAVLREQQKVVYQYCTYAIHYLTLHPQFETTEVCGQLMRLMVHFPNHSFLFHAIRNFFWACLRTQERMEQVVSMLGPVLMITAQSNRGIAKSFAMEMIGWLSDPNLAGMVARVPGLGKFLRDVYGPWQNMIEKQYGGKLEEGN